MSWDSVLYMIEIGNSSIASTDVDNIRWLLESCAPGRYAINEVTNSGGLLSKMETRRWGWAFKGQDGRVVLRSGDNEPSAVDLATEKDQPCAVMCNEFERTS